MRRVAAALAVCGLGLAGCGAQSDYPATRRALEGLGYRNVSVTVRSGGGIVVARVDARSPIDRGPDTAVETVWRTLPVRFDQLVVAGAPVYGYDDLVARFGPRDPTLDRSRPGDAGGRTRSELLAVVTLGAVLAGAGLVAGILLVRRGLRAGRQQMDQTEGPGSGLGAASPMADGSGAGAGEMPS
jgi:hypothetical protein